MHVFHSTWYSRFTALPNDGEASESALRKAGKHRLLRSEIVTHASTSSFVRNQGKKFVGVEICRTDYLNKMRSCETVFCNCHEVMS